jgi:hypothetical protein
MNRRTFVDRDPQRDGVVAHLSAGGFGYYHRLNCSDAPERGGWGVRDVIWGPWAYLSRHYHPCPTCRPPVLALDQAA